MDELRAIKDFWSEPWDSFEYHEQRSHMADIEWLIEKVEELQREIWMLESALDASHGIITECL